MKIQIAVALLFGVTTASSAQSSPCDPNIERNSRGGVLGYQARGNYCGRNGSHVWRGAPGRHRLRTGRFGGGRTDLLLGKQRVEIWGCLRWEARYRKG